MSQPADNRRRAFADAVAVDAWHGSFSDSNGRVDLHADVVFGTARVGGEPESPVRFRLRIKRAELVVVVPEFEPVGIDPSSVSRDAAEREGKWSESSERTIKAEGSGAIAVSVSPSSLSGSLSTSASGQGSFSHSSSYQISGAIRLIEITQSKTAEGHYRWLFKPRDSTALEGRPWDAAKAPRLTLIDKRKESQRGLEPSVRVEIRCRREDLEIEDLAMKDEGMLQQAMRRVGFANRMAAAESYIRDRLLEEGLEAKNIYDPFGEITLNSVTAVSI